jgi:hypothetical protein
MSTQIAAPGIILDKRKIDGHGMAMSGYLEALTDMLTLFQQAYSLTRDRTERKVLEAIIEPLEERVEQVASDLNHHAHNIGAIRLAKGLTGVQ